MTQQATLMTTHKLSITGSDLPAGDASVAPTAAAAPAGKVQILKADERHLEIHYYDAPDKMCRRWLLPRAYAEDLVRWWVEQGCTQAPWGGLAPQQCVGRICVSIPSHTVVYVRGCNARGRPNITGFQFPRAVVEALALTPILQDNEDNRP